MDPKASGIGHTSGSKPVWFNMEHNNAVPKETLERVLAYYKLVIDDVSDKIVESSDDEDDLDDLIGGLSD